MAGRKIGKYFDTAAEASAHDAAWLVRELARNNIVASTYVSVPKKLTVVYFTEDKAKFLPAQLGWVDIADPQRPVYYPKNIEQYYFGVVDSVVP